MKIRMIVGMFLMALLLALGIDNVSAQDRYRYDRYGYRYENGYRYDRYGHRVKVKTYRSPSVKVYTTPTYQERTYRGYKRYHKYPNTCVRTYNGRRVYERCR
jgi:hypothetical protein